MFLLKPLLTITLATATYAQESTMRPVVLPELAPFPKIKAVVPQTALPAPTGSPITQESTSFAVYQNTVYLKVGDMVVPMVGTTGCFMPKELLKAGDTRLHFNDEPPAPPPPPKH